MTFSPFAANHLSRSDYLAYFYSAAHSEVCGGISIAARQPKGEGPDKCTPPRSQAHLFTREAIVAECFKIGS
jgi:hypothetical protein